MAFKIVKSDTYKWPVSVESAVDGGRFQKETFEAEFKRLPQSRIKEIYKQIKEEALSEDKDLCKEVLLGWSGVSDESGQDMPFSESNRDKLLDVPNVASSVVVAFFESLAGARRKN